MSVATRLKAVNMADEGSAGEGRWSVEVALTDESDNAWLIEVRNAPAIFSVAELTAVGIDSARQQTGVYDIWETDWKEL